MEIQFSKQGIKNGAIISKSLPNTPCIRSPTKYVGATLAPHASAGVVVGVCAFSGSFCRLKLVPAKRVVSSRPLVAKAGR